MSRHHLTMQTPAGNWREGLPVGNGAVGAMPYGRVHQERILLNHEQLWYRGHTDELPDISTSLAELRSLMEQKDYNGANDVYYRTLKKLDYKVDCASYHPAADLCIELRLSGAFRDYHRWLDMEAGSTSVRWDDDGTEFQRDCFVSRVNDLVVTRMTASHSRSVHAKLSLTEHDLADALLYNGEAFIPPIRFERRVQGDQMRLIGHYLETDPNHRDRRLHDPADAAQSPPETGERFAVVSRVIHHDGSLVPSGDGLEVKNADEVIILTGIAAHNPDDATIAKLEATLAEAAADYAEHFEAHRRQHAELYHRTGFALETDTTDTSNEALLLEAYGGEAPLELVEKMAHYGRYLLVCSSRPDGLPSNLQGIWNGDYAPAWDAFFMINENLQMNYWQALPGQLPEALRGMIDFYTSFMDDFRENAKKLYGCRGIFIPSIMSPKTGLATHTGSWIINWVSGAGWLAQHFYDYYLYTGDQEFLADRLLPFMLEIADFFEDFLYEAPNGELTVCPSVSPENWPAEFCDPAEPPECSETARITYNATMDVAVIKELLTNLIAIHDATGGLDDRVATWRSIIDRLPAYQLNEDGAVREWLHPDFSDNYHHRHQSHLYPVFPGCEVEQDDQPELYQAFKVAVDKRLVVGINEQTGWSLAHMANINARLGDADTALECLDILARSCLGQNLFTYHNDFRHMGITGSGLKFGISAPFQIDANMGWTAAVYEMLLFSRQNELTLLPALPQRWRKGSITGLATKGGLHVDVSWDQDDGTAYSATITASRDYTGTLKRPGAQPQPLKLAAGETLTVEA